MQPAPPTNLLELIAKSSVHLVIFNKQTEKPIQYGSGCLAWYREKLFILSVDHVTRIKGVETYARIETGLPAENGLTPFYQTGALVVFDVFKPNHTGTDENTPLTFEKDDPLDITFTTVQPGIAFLQRPFEFMEMPISGGSKIILNLDHAVEPEADDYFGFFGQIQHDVFDEKLIISKGTFKLDLVYTGTSRDGYHNFLYPEVIASKKAFEGTSGAPIINSKGQLVGLASSVLENTRSVFAFSIGYCKKLIDTAIAQGLV
jgi:hypothetical protein